MGRKEEFEERYVVVLTPDAGTTRMGILMFRDSILDIAQLCVQCPECSLGHLSYQNSIGIQMNCSSCSKNFFGFKGTGIPKELLLHGGEYSQVHRVNTPGVNQWIDRWTGLKDVSVTVSTS